MFPLSCLLRRTTLLSSSAPRLHLLPSLASHRIPKPQRSRSFFPKPLKSSRFFSSHRLFCHHPQRSEEAELSEGAEVTEESPNLEGDRMIVGIGNPRFPVRMGMYRMSLGDQAVFLLAFIACTTSVAFTSLVIAAVPTLYAMKRAATSLARLADAAREELPSTMAAIRLSGMEICDLTLELSDLSQEIADGVSKSAQAVQAAEAEIRQIAMIQKRANLLNISLQPMVAGAAKKTSKAVGHAKKAFMNLISRGGEYDSDSEEDSDRVEYCRIYNKSIFEPFSEV